MNFFLTIHRSIVDPAFYKEIISYRTSKIFLYFITLILFISLVSSIAQFFYMVDYERGIPIKIENLFKGMEIKNGILDPKAPTPIVPPTYLVDQLSGLKGLFSSDHDSLIVIDTAKARNYRMKVPAIIMTADKAVVVFNKDVSMGVPYKSLLFGKNDLQINAAEIKHLLVSNFSTIVIGTFIANVFQNTMTLLFSILFLAMIAFFFRIERTNSIEKYVRIATYSITPMAVGFMLVAISGVKIFWSWHVLIFVSTVVLFRALFATANPPSSVDDSGDL